MSKEVILTGIRSNGELTLGNYLGAIKPMVDLQKKHAGDKQLNLFVPDLHSFITPVDHSQLYQNTLDNLKVFTAAGLNLDQPDTLVYRQSYVSAHSELTWILNCFAYMGELSRMTQYKDKSDGQANVGVGIFDYPVLMAADIVLYDAAYVPVGEDQRQHLELTRDLAQRINNKFGLPLLSEPLEWSKQLEFAASFGAGTRIRSLKHPDKKMSKSVSDPAGTILLTDPPAEAAKKVMSATTDSVGVIHLDWTNQPGISNLLTIGSLLSGKDLAAEWDGKANYGDLKAVVAAEVQQFLTDLQTKLAAVTHQQVLAALERGEAAANKTANQKLEQVQRAVGLRP